jgi:2-C-methyl-D-erythritol 4-phosphate cytidylyltransferase/2-C-methyl-D-erythritol 2,4-cyclodiphosphate synthase
MSVTALIVAAGRGRRLGGERPKQYLPLCGVALLRRTVQVFLAHPAIDGVRVVIGPDDAELYAEAVAGLELPPPVVGGDTRQVSVLNGLESLAATPPDHILIHDAARPFVSATDIDDVLSALAATAGAISALPVVDTIKRQDGDGIISDTVDRSGLWRALTPQGFRYEDILAAHQAASGQNLTDDAAVAEIAGLDVALVSGSRQNIKITTAEDFILAEKMLMQTLTDVRTGQGVDAHRFAASAPESGAIRLCGIDVPHDRSLAGHSDADVGLHAATDALLAAIADHDIGHHFPPGDDQWKGAASDIFLSFARDRVAARGGVIANVDVTLICESPKVGPHRDAMRARLGEILNLATDRISVKATTTEKMGFTGRGEGIAAQATATVRLP